MKNTKKILPYFCTEKEKFEVSNYRFVKVEHVSLPVGEMLT